MATLRHFFLVIIVLSSTLALKLPTNNGTANDVNENKNLKETEAKVYTERPSTFPALHTSSRVPTPSALPTVAAVPTLSNVDSVSEDVSTDDISEEAEGFASQINGFDKKSDGSDTFLKGEINADSVKNADLNLGTHGPGNNGTQVHEVNNNTSVSELEDNFLGGKKQTSVSIKTSTETLFVSSPPNKNLGTTFLKENTALNGSESSNFTIKPSTGGNSGRQIGKSAYKLGNGGDSKTSDSSGLHRKNTKFMGRRVDWKGRLNGSRVVNSEDNSEVTCYCNLGQCALKGYICRSTTGICYIKRYYSNATSFGYRKLQHVYGCYENLETVLRDRCSVQARANTPSPRKVGLPSKEVVDDGGKATPPTDEEDILLSCCAEDVCNYERPNTVYLHTHLAPKGVGSNVLYGDDPNSAPSSGRYHLTAPTTSTIFTVAAILVPLVGVVLFVIVVALGVRLLSIEGNRRVNGPRYQYHKAPDSDPKPQDNLNLHHYPLKGPAIQGLPPPYTIHHNYINKSCQTSPCVEEKKDFYSAMPPSVEDTCPTFDHYLRALDEHHTKNHNHHMHHSIEAYRQDFNKLLSGEAMPSPSPSPRVKKHLSSFRSRKPPPAKFYPQNCTNDPSLAGYLMPLCHKKSALTYTKRKAPKVVSRYTFQPNDCDSIYSSSPQTMSPTPSPSSSPNKTLKASFPNSPSSPGLYTHTFSSPARSDFSPGEVEFQGRSFVEAILSRREDFTDKSINS